MPSKSRVLGVECLDEAEPGQSGVLSCEVIPYSELDDDVLETLFEQSPDFVMEKRPDWIQKHHPECVH